jgi:hypothetical protein
LKPFKAGLQLKQLRDVQLPRYIAKAKLASLSVAAMLLAALAFAALRDIIG